MLNSHPSHHGGMEANLGLHLPLPLPPPPYSTLPTRGSNQRRLNHDQSSSPHHHGGQPTSSSSQACSVLPSYHHLYSSASPSSLRRRRRRLRQRRRESHLTENRKYLIFISFVFVVGIVLTFVGVLTLSLFTLSFGFTFILFSLLLYKLLPSSKYAVNLAASPSLSPHHTHPYIISDPSLSLPPPPPSYAEALNSTQLVQLQPNTFINRGGGSCAGNPNHHPVNNSSAAIVSACSSDPSSSVSTLCLGASGNSCVASNSVRVASDPNRQQLHFVTIIEATI